MYIDTYIFPDHWAKKSIFAFGLLEVTTSAVFSKREFLRFEWSYSMALYAGHCQTSEGLSYGRHY